LTSDQSRVSPQALSVVGPYRGGSGYDRHTRAFVREFARQGVEIELRLLPGWSSDLPPGLRDAWFDQLVRPIPTDRTLFFTMPSQVVADLGRFNINYTMFEAEHIPHFWAAAAMRVDRIVLPTEACMQAWEDSGVPADKLRLSPLGVDAAHFRTPASPLPIRLPDGRPASQVAHRFLNIADLRPRKNHMGLLRTWLRNTSQQDDAVLILKTPQTNSRAFGAFVHDLQELQHNIGISLSDAAPIIVISETLSDAEMLSLYAAATHYVSLSHGEGWDLPMMEAAVAGLQLIAPAHSGYISYLRPGDAFFIPSPLGPATFEGQLGPQDSMFFAGLNWWIPDEGLAGEIVRAVIRGETPDRPAPSERLAAEYDWPKVTQRLREIVFA
jgi:glycosyltransferase involved in cell wall biosynthesis